MQATCKAVALLAGDLVLNHSAAVLAETHSASAITQYQMAAISNRAHGRAVLSGDYDKAITQLLGQQQRFESSTNLCVAYTLNGDLDKAGGACKTALRISEQNARLLNPRREVVVRRDLAIALSNQGVLLAISGDLGGARQNFAKAVELHTDIQQATVNLTQAVATRAADSKPLESGD
ncbi:MAG: hypothetical protein AB8B57_12050 [Congregibacter sp.]